MPITAVPSVYHVQRRYSICPATFMGMETGTASITHSVDRDRPLPRLTLVRELKSMKAHWPGLRLTRRPLDRNLPDVYCVQCLLKQNILGKHGVERGT
ncbi:uncharacterized protein LOC144132498 isoform X2 [Amblyomma americanum]